MRSSEIMRRIEACRDLRRLAVLIAEMEDAFTPLDFADALANSPSPMDGGPLAATIIRRQLSRGPPEGYRRTAIIDDIALLSDPDHPRAGKTLLLGWTGRGFRIGLPIVSFAQLLPSRLYDIVVLRDPRRLGFAHGIADYADTLPAVAARLRADLEFDSYARVVTLGASSGGLPALRAALLLSAERGISFGGLFHWQIPELLSGTGTFEAPGYDILCACGPTSRSRLIGVYGEQNERDRRHADILASICRIERITVATRSHTVLFELLKKGVARSFLRQVLTF